MSETAGIIYRLEWKRDGWTKMNSSLHKSQRGAISSAAKLDHATVRYGLKALTLLRVTEGTAHWGRSFDVADIIGDLKPSTAPTVNVGAFETWSPELQKTRGLMIRVGGYDETVPLAEVVRFHKNMEEDE